MDLSGLIFVALAIAWAAYLIPKALKHHEEATRTRTVDKFSDRMRVLASREPVSKRDARLVMNRPRSAVPGSATPVAEAPPAAAPSRRETTNRAARRRRRVLALLLLAVAAVAGVAAAGYIGWVWVAAPAGLLAAWLVACRLMVRRERAWRPAPAVQPADDVAETAERPAVLVDDAETDSFATVESDPALWDPVPVTLPTYVSKSAAPRSVRTIDLDSTGVWTSGRSESDSQLARDAEEADRADRAERAQRDDRAVGS